MGWLGSWVVAALVVVVGFGAGASAADGRPGTATATATATATSVMAGAEGGDSRRFVSTTPDARSSPDGPLDRAGVSPRWSWPLAPVRVVGAFAAPPSPYAAGHRGVDLAARPGATIAAPADATVHFVGVVVDRPVLTLDHGSGVLSSYEPLEAAGLAAGDRVTRGTVLGVVGEGAHCSGACLHVGVRVDGEYVSPLLFFDRLPRSVLLPLRAGGHVRASSPVVPPSTRDAITLAPVGRRDGQVRRGGGRCGRPP